MENTPFHVARSIPGWNDSLRDLKRLRHIRNALVHDTEGYDYTQDDVELIRSYYQRIMTQQDPLALLRIQEDNKAKAYPKPFINRWDGAYNTNPAKKEDEGSLSFGKAASVFVLTIAVAVGLLAFGYLMLK